MTQNTGPTYRQLGSVRSRLIAEKCEDTLINQVTTFLTEAWPRKSILIMFMGVMSRKYIEWRHSWYFNQ